MNILISNAKGELFQVKRKYLASIFIKDGEEDKDKLQFFRDWFRCDRVLKHNEYYLFCTEVETIEYLLENN